jgi:hypothetical protein
MSFSDYSGYLIGGIVVGLLVMPLFNKDTHDYEDTKANVNTTTHNKHTTDIIVVEDVLLVGDTYPLLRDGVIPVLSARRDASI